MCNSYLFVRAMVAASLVTVIAASARADRSRFDGLGVPSGGASFAAGVSADGRVVAGNLGSPFLGSQGFVWTSSTGIVPIGLYGVTRAATQVLGISGDGSTVVGSANTDTGQAIRWTPMYGLQPIPGGAAYAASFDGAVVVGEAPISGGTTAFRWSAITGLVPLGNLHGTQPGNSGARAVSADGLAITGYTDPFVPFPGHNEAFRWTPNSLMVGLGWLPGTSDRSQGNALSADGSIVVGESAALNGVGAFRWSGATGMVSLGSLPGGSPATRALGVSADGNVIVGSAVSGSASVAFIWTPATGMRELGAYLLSTANLDTTGWSLTLARAVSADGKTIVGDGTDPCGHQQAWIVHLGTAPPCPVDFNADGALSVQDIFDYLSAWFAGDARADFNHASCLTIQDIFEFLTAWFAGCPS